MNAVTPVLLDLVGIGFGPSNLALALALDEGGRHAADSLRRVFLERKPRFSWHSGMLLEGARMQVSFLKDLVSQRDPTSPHSFLCYLKSRGRLTDFINLRDFFPTRLEFHDYFEWCAQAVSNVVRYGQDVVRVEPYHPTGGAISALAVVARRPDGIERTYLARALSLAMGIAPKFPPGVQPDSRIWHASEFVPRLEALGSVVAAGTRFAVVGAGQSAAEAVCHLLDRFPQIRVHAIVSRYGFVPADSSPFVNGVFDPDSVDRFFAMDPTLRAFVREIHAGTNYGAVDECMIKALFERHYADRVAGCDRLVIENLSRLTGAEGCGGALRLTLSPARGDGPRTLDVDYLVCATGYDPVPPDHTLTPELRDLLARDASGAPIIERDYRLRTQDRLRALLYVQGYGEASHGLSATLLSNVAPRAGEIRDDIAARIAALAGGASAIGPSDPEPYRATATCTEAS
jgi:L-ornithine N5-oxygenase